jgi:metal-responsive CopG/Arc/MetJ family transcriptional regulator
LRTIVDLPEKDIKTLDLIAKRLNVSRANLIRKCVRNYLDTVGSIGSTISSDIFGSFRDVFDTDSVEIQRTMRQSWGEREDFGKIPYIDTDEEKQEDEI